jgi:predicted nucleotidyltransferase
MSFDTAGTQAATTITREAVPEVANNGLIGVSRSEASALARQINGISVDGNQAVSSIEAFGSRAGSMFRGRGPTAASDLDVFVTLNSNVVNSPAAMRAVQSQLGEIGDLWEATKGFPLQPVSELDSVAPAVKLQLQQTPFIPLQEAK